MEDNGSAFLYPDTGMRLSRSNHDFSYLIQYLNNPTPSNGTNNGADHSSYSNAKDGTTEVSTQTDQSSTQLQSNCTDNSAGMTGSVRTALYYYDQESGTTTRKLPCLGVVTASAAAGGYAVSRFADQIVNKLSTNWPQVAGVVEKYPAYCGATAAAGLACGAIYELRKSLKPVTTTGVQAVMDTVSNNLRMAHNTQLLSRETLHRVAERREMMKEALHQEREQNRQLALRKYEEALAHFDQHFDLMALSLGSMVGWELLRKYSGNLPHLGDNVSQTENPENHIRRIKPLSISKTILVAASVSQFITGRDTPFFPRYKLLNILKPVLSQDEYRNVYQLIRQCPQRPSESEFLVSGAVEQEYSRLILEEQANSANFQKAREDIARIMTQYPGFSIDEHSNVKEPSLEKFRRNMPE